MIGPCKSVDTSNTNNNVKLKLIKILNDGIHCLQCVHRENLYLYSYINHTNSVYFSEDVKNKLLVNNQYYNELLKKGKRIMF